MEETENKRKELMSKAQRLSEIAGRIPSKSSEFSQKEEAQKQFTKIMEQINALGARALGTITFEKIVTTTYRFVEGTRKTNLIQDKKGSLVPDDWLQGDRVEIDPTSGEPTKLFSQIISAEMQGPENVYFALKIVTHGDAEKTKLAKVAQQKQSDWRLTETWTCSLGHMNSVEVASCVRCGKPREEPEKEKQKRGLFRL
jgi:hypothetical protein